ncbi:MAG: carotenoid oxygenase family protein [Actinomycetota bacterium]
MTLADDTTKPFHLNGNFAPVMDEITAHDLEVIGALPPELDGLYVRNGANPPNADTIHWFLGQGMLHGVRIEGGRASWYRNRYVRTALLEQPETPRITEDMSFDRTISLANTHVIRHAGKILALEEGSFPWVVDDQLDTVGSHDFDGKLDTAMTAHPKECPETGELHFFGYGQLPPYLTYHVADAEGRIIRSMEIPVNGPTMIHDFGVSRRHGLFMDLPVVFDMEAAMLGQMPFHWSDDYPARVGVLPRDTDDIGELRWFEVDPCYVFHPLNAFDDGDDVVFDVCRISELWRTAGEFDTDGTTTLHRWRFDMSTGTTKEETLHERPQDFPRVPDALTGLQHRYGYCTATGGMEILGATELFQHDLVTGSVTSHNFGAGRHPGEGVFVPAANATSENDGWVMTYVHDDAEGASEFVVLDATDFAAAPVARVPLPQRVPYGFHGSWLSSS